ncbi:MAG: PhoPQ-activated protein PqaA family protein [Alphaproteobacteria bacterium]
MFKFNFNEVLPSYLNLDENVYNWELLSSNYDTKYNVNIDIYSLKSQIWPLNSGQVWEHNLIIYKPDNILHNTALLYANGGYNNNITGAKLFSPPKIHENLNFASLAAENNAVLIEIQNLPNQYIFFEDKIPKKEDEIISYSFKKVLENPEQNAYYAGHLPMAKAIVKAMDAAQEIAKEKYNDDIENFVAVGASKRGWAVWLAAIADERISAIIPIVIDILNTEKNIKHICDSYKEEIPPALRNYNEDGMIDHIGTENMKKLMMIEDPLSYKDNKETYKRLSIPKYIINSSGDDFFVPDSSNLYFKDLPGEKNYIRYLPNSSHYADSNIVQASVSNYFKTFVNNIDLPKINWEFDNNSIHINSSEQPIYAKLWTAHNPVSRDFRYNNYSFSGNSKGNIRYIETDISFDHADLDFNIPLPTQENGWQANFIELGYDIKGIPMIFTTGVNITPDIYPT